MKKEGRVENERKKMRSRRRGSRRVGGQVLFLCVETCVIELYIMYYVSIARNDNKVLPY
jgi:hypothetical protein